MNEILSIILVFCIVLFSVICHELSHGLVALWLGDDTAKNEGRLTLNPIRHIDPIMSILVPVVLYILRAPVFGGAKPVPVNRNNLKYKEFGMALVALAGPLSNFLIALIAFLIGHFTGLMYGNNIFFVVFFDEFVLVNLSLMVFNLLPIPPLDGSRLLYFLAPDGIRILMDRMEKYGFIIIYIIVLLGGGLFSSLIGKIMNGVLDLFYFLVGNV